MKILHVVGSIDTSGGGPSRSVPQTCEYLSLEGEVVELLTRPSAQPVKTNTSTTFQVSFHSLLDLVLYAFRLNKKEVALIHLQHVWDPYIHIMALAARLKGIPYIITPRGMLEPWIMQRHPRRKKIAMWLYQRRDMQKAVCIHATCEAEKESVRALGFGNPVAIIPNGIDLSVVPCFEKPTSTKKIVFLSRIHPKKGIELLLQSWQQLQLTDWTLEIAGEGDSAYQAQLEQQIIANRISNVHFVGAKYGTEKWDFLSSADVMILPTYSENFGIVVAEALAVGTPVITTKGTPWQELETWNCGWWIDLSVTNLMQAITTATNCTQQERLEMGQRGRKLIEQHYSITLVAGKVKQLYEWVNHTTDEPDFVREPHPSVTGHPKVLHFITSIDKTAGGTTAYMQLLSAELKPLVDLVVVTGLSPNPVYLEDVHVQFFDLSLNRWCSLATEFRKFLEVSQPDIVHINGIWEPQCWLFQQVAQGLGIKVVLSPHGMLESYILHRHSMKKKMALALYQRRALRRVDYFHTTAQSELDQVRKLGYTQPAVVIANGIKTTDVLPKTEWKAVQNILFLSRVHPKKGIDLLIEAVAQLPATALHITIAGEGDAAYVEELKRLAIQRKVAHQFHFIGGVYGKQKWELYQRSDLFVLPTYSENFGIVVPEALYTGLPVLTTTGTPWQELETEKCGWWIELNVANLTNALNEALQLNAKELKGMGMRGRQLVGEKYEIKEVAKEMKEFYTEVLNEK